MWFQATSRSERLDLLGGAINLTRRYELEHSGLFHKTDCCLEAIGCGVWRIPQVGPRTRGQSPSAFFGDDFQSQNRFPVAPRISESACDGPIYMLTQDPRSD